MAPQGEPAHTSADITSEFEVPIAPGGQPEVGGVADTSSLISQLSELREKGVLTDEQYEVQKQRLLS